MGDRSARNRSTEPEGRCDDVRQHLADIYDACAEGLFRYAAVLLADPAAAEDAVHQVFAKLAAMGRRLDEIGAMAAYLRQAVRNECFGLLKRQSRRRQTAEHTAALLEAAPGDVSEGLHELRQALERSLRALPTKQREVVHMKVYERMTFEQIAKMLAIPTNTAVSRYRYALLRLRKLLGPCGEGRE